MGIGSGGASGSVRRASHAGSWYEGDAAALRDELQRLLGAEYADGVTSDASLKAIISPHAGLRYSGSVAAGVYARLDVQSVRRIFLIGPSHHAHIDGCGLPAEGVTAYRTPLGDLPLDTATLAELRRTREFATLTMSVDEAEHSLEMQLPFLAQLLLNSPLRGSRSPATIVPILVGQVSAGLESQYGRLLAPYLEEEGTFFVISSDFCHWGAQFGYTRTGSPALAETYRHGPHPDNARIEGLDREGMAFIANQDANGFRQYLARDHNTICGRHPILVFLEALAASKASPLEVDFVKYAQSSAMPGMPPPTTASVSYACACCRPVGIGR
ncbi:unnamed protein product [Polarella glacialis]|uniref:Protein MEMO1 n=1 Tax=Polarella glacialis TaxID=89957 RepID=A0A813GGV5_POLGL|nr:unnamed protein product [Polarella glacialis]CAE8705832.1 unnamed protein product [Polarella glacialis]